MKLISEYNDNKLEVISESTENGSKDYYIEGVFAQAEAKNRNGRVYQKTIMESAVNRYIQEEVDTGRAVGELDHPAGPQINLDRISHKITNLEWSGNDVIGKARILETPMGQIVKGLLAGGVQLGVSTRGMGSLESREGVMYVKEDFVLKTVDIVQDPSAPTAFVNGIQEGVEYFYDEDANLYLPATEAKEQMASMSKTEIAESQMKLFKDFLSKVGSPR